MGENSKNNEKPFCGEKQALKYWWCCYCPSRVIPQYIPYIIGYKGPTGEKGPAGDQGPPGPAGSAAQDGCALQMRHVLAQLIAKYPCNKFKVILENGKTVTDRPVKLYPPRDGGPYTGFLQMRTKQINACKIGAVAVMGAAYDDKIDYLSTPGAPVKSCGDIIRPRLRIGDTAEICVGGMKTFIGIVRKIEYGMIVLAGNDGLNPVFISACKILTISRPREKFCVFEKIKKPKRSVSGTRRSRYATITE